MHGGLTGFVLGFSGATLLITNTVLWGVPFYLVIATKVMIRTPRWQQWCDRTMMRMGEGWIACNNLLIRSLYRIDWDVEGFDGLRRDRWYFVSSNHQCWLDIPVLQGLFNTRIPFLKFFLKKEMIWLPILGGVFWAMDFPFMKRFPKELLKARPDLRGKDLEITRRACERFRHTPVSIINFVEGTRFTTEKHSQQSSPYKHLLRPKAGGTAFAVTAMDGIIDTMLDVTIFYPGGAPNFWEFLCGYVRKITVRIEQVRIPDDLLHGDYDQDPQFRERFQKWITDLWDRKDRFLEQLAHASTTTTPHQPTVLRDNVPPL